MEFIGAVILEWGSIEIECVSISVEANSNGRVIKTISKSGVAKGHANGIPDYKLTVEVPIPTGKSEPFWMSIKDAKMTIAPIDDKDPREVYKHCKVESMSSKYQVDGVAMRTLGIVALEYTVQK